MSTVPAYLVHFVDDAAIFPPGNAPLVEAVPAHREMRSSVFYDEFVGPFIVDVKRLDALIAITAADPIDPALEVSVVVPEPAVVQSVLDSAGAASGITLVGLEIRVAQRDAALQQALQEIARVVEGTQGTIQVFIELPWPTQDEAGWAEDLEQVGRAGFFLKFRTGGTSADAFPNSQRLARALAIAARNEIPFKCTAGLHWAARRTDPATGFEHHGFLNILVATLRAHDGGSLAESSAILELRDERILAAALANSRLEQVVKTRSLFRSYGSCSVEEPLEELERLGLVQAGHGGK